MLHLWQIMDGINIRACSSLLHSQDLGGHICCAVRGDQSGLSRRERQTCVLQQSVHVVLDIGHGVQPLRNLLAFRLAKNTSTYVMVVYRALILVAQYSLCMLEPEILWKL